MFKTCFKTYWQTFKYVFAVLGIIFLALLISGSMIEAGAEKQITGLTENIKVVTGNTDLTVNRVRDAIDAKIKDIKPSEAINDVKDGNIEEKTKETILGAISGVIKNYVKYATKLVALVAAALVAFSIVVIVSLIVLFFGILLSHDITYIFSRYEIKRDNIIEIWLELALKNLMQIFAFAAVLAIAIALKPFGFILLIGYPLLYCYLALLSGWITAGEDRPAYKDVCSFRNVVLMLAADAIILAISAVITFLFILAGNAVLGAIAGLTLFIMNMSTFTLNASAYIFNGTENREAA